MGTSSVSASRVREASLQQRVFLIVLRSGRGKETIAREPSREGESAGYRIYKHTGSCGKYKNDCEDERVGVTLMILIPEKDGSFYILQLDRESNITTADVLDVIGVRSPQRRPNGSH